MPERKQGFVLTHWGSPQWGDVQGSGSSGNGDEGALTVEEEPPGQGSGQGPDPWDKGRSRTAPRKGASLVAQLVKNSPAVRETWVRSLGWEDSLEKA